MNEPRKLSHPESEVTKLKVLWRDSLPEEERDYWRHQFASPRSRVKVREELAVKLGVKLAYDVQLERFCAWLADEEVRVREEELMESDREQLAALGLDGDRLRVELMRRMKERALARGDYKLGRDVLRLDLKAEALANESRRVELREKKLKGTLTS